MLIIYTCSLSHYYDDYKFMKEHALDVPYDLQVVHALKDLGVNIEKTLDHQVLIKKVAQ